MNADNGTHAEAVVVGGGVVGAAVLWELARQGVDAVLLEAAADVGEGASKGNSAIVHTGFDARPGTLEARALREAASVWPSVIDTLGVPFLRLGAVMIARTKTERGRLRTEIESNASSLGVHTEFLERADLRTEAPFVTDDAVAGLYVPDEAVIDPFWLTRAFAESAIGGGARVVTRARVTAIEIERRDVAIGLADGTTWRASHVFDCAGIAADEVAQLAGDRTFTIRARKGQFLVSEESFGVDRIVLPIPGPMGKGMLVTPIVFGGLLLGPTAVDQDDKADRSTQADTSRDILAACASLVPALREAVPVRSFAGLRTVSSTGDYILGPSRVTDRITIVAGIRSTGISASPAIAEGVVRAAGRLRRWKTGMAPRVLVPPPMEERQPREIVCVCRSISRGEVEAACRRPMAPSTLDAVKRRGGAMFGDCQGNLCAIDVARIVAEERVCALTSVEKSEPGSWVFAERRDQGGRDGAIHAPAVSQPSATDGTSDLIDVVVVGGGLAGVAAALAVRQAGARALVIERQGRLLPSRLQWTAPERRHLDALPSGAPGLGLDTRLAETVVGLMERAGGWVVATQGQHGSTELRARAVVIATGGYVQPREHRAISGPRPAGIVTSDLVAAAAAAGVAPGQAAVVIGRGRVAKQAHEQLLSLGCRIVAQRPEDRIGEVRGSARLEAVRDDGRWIDCDTLVFADRLLPQTFLLRALGLTDGRPDRPAPVDPIGTLGMANLWAAGTCVLADIEHADSFADGLRVGRAVAASLTSPAIS